MGGEALWELVKVFLAALVASALTHLLTHRRFIQGRWWDRKAKAYCSITGSLVELAQSLGWGVVSEKDRPPNRRYFEEDRKVAVSKYREARAAVERAVIEGDFFISKRASSRLQELMEVLAARDLPDHPHDYRAEVESCLEVIRDAGKSDLRVKWYSFL